MTETRIRYAVHPRAHMVEPWIAALPAQTGRLLETGGFATKDRITHRFAITSVDQVDAEVGQWLETACRMDE